MAVDAQLMLQQLGKLCRLPLALQPVPSATSKRSLLHVSSKAKAAEGPAPMRLIVNATSDSQVSSNPILGDGPPGTAAAGEDT